MITLRGFVRSLLPGRDKDGMPMYWSKPDRSSVLFEVRKLKSRDIYPRTSFYEFFWAHHMVGTKVSHIAHWLRQLLFRREKNVPERIVPIWKSIWYLLVVLLLFVATGTVDYFTDLKMNLGWSVSFVLSAVLGVVNLIVVRYVGDAARYLDPSRTNIAVRQKIRSDGMQLIRNLHNSGYDRIIVVGHSLGSLIAYDILTHLWPEYNTVHGRPLNVEQDALRKVQLLGQSLGHRPSGEELDKYHNLQGELWEERRRMGNPWLVTDLVTLGSPLSYADFLLAESDDDLKERINLRDLPACPPVVDDKGYSYVLKPPYRSYGLKRSIKVLHHAAQFAFIRWTNLYFPGDIIGGPVADKLGWGIRDVEVLPGKKSWKDRFLFTHSWYWRNKPIPPVGEWKESEAVKALREALMIPGKWNLKNESREAEVQGFQTKDQEVPLS